MTINNELKQGRYKITKLVSQRETVSFYEAYDKVAEKTVLIKESEVKLSKVTTSAQLEAQNNAFAGEAGLLMGIRHEGFLQVLDHFSEIGHQYLMIESVDGENLTQLLKRENKPLPLADIVYWGEQLLDALDYLHQQTPPAIYLNITPPNIHLTANGRVKLLATGLRTKSNEPTFEPTQEFPNLNYSPLELIFGRLDPASQRVVTNSFDEKSIEILMRPPCPQSDVYALGATLYRLLTGKPPIDALERSIDILEDKPDPLVAPTLINPRISMEISDVLLKALEIRREYRFESAAEMRREMSVAFTQLKERKARELSSEVPVELPDPAMKLKVFKRKKEIEKQAIEQVPREESSQLAMIKQKLAEAERQRILAEQRAAEAEKRLLEKEFHDSSDGQMPTPLVVSSPEDQEELPVQLTEITIEAPVDMAEAEADQEPEELIVAESEAEAQDGEFVEPVSFEEPEPTASEKTDFHGSRNDAADDFDTMFAAPPPGNRFVKRAAAVVIALLVLGGGAWGLMNWLPSKADQPAQISSTDLKGPDDSTAADQSVSSETTTDPASEAVTEIPGETTDAPAGNPQPVAPETTARTASAKDRPASTTVAPTTVNPAETRPPTELTTGSGEQPRPQIADNKKPQNADSKKKKVTVDDLINDTPKKKVTVDDLINDN